LSRTPTLSRTSGRTLNRSLCRTFSTALACLAWIACAATASAGVVVTGPWVRATVPAQTSTAAYLRIDSDVDLQLVQVSSPVAQRCEIHEVSLQQDVMRMRSVDRLAIPAHQPVLFEQQHRHLMLQGLDRVLKEGDRVVLKFAFVDAQGKHRAVQVEAPVRGIDAEAGGSSGARP
jgi:periplasmic copper chaperone A